jgi:hypothetical protein
VLGKTEPLLNQFHYLGKIRNCCGSSNPGTRANVAPDTQLRGQARFLASAASRGAGGERQSRGIDRLQCGACAPAILITVRNAKSERYQDLSGPSTSASSAAPSGSSVIGRLLGFWPVGFVRPFPNFEAVNHRAFLTNTRSIPV